MHLSNLGNAVLVCSETLLKELNASSIDITLQLVMFKKNRDDFSVNSKIEVP